jgi:polysaccharide export outer membrane protein
MDGLKRGMRSIGRVFAPRIAILAFAVVAAALSGCNRSAIPGLTTPGYALATPAPLPSPGPLPLTPPVNGVQGVPANPYGAYRLDSGDRVRVTVFGQDNLSRVYNVDATGSVAMPLIGPVRARGSTPVQLSMDIEEELRRKYIKDPKVSVEIETYRPFFILGEVNKPGGYPYVNGMTAEGAVAIAEGYSERARKRMVRLTRRFNGVNSTVMVPTDYPVQPGDTIYVLERIF